MGLFSKKKQTNIYEDYGLDEEQFDALSAGQTSITSEVQKNYEALQASAASAQANYEAAQAQRDNAMAAAAGAAAGAQADAAQKFGQLQGDITGGFTATKNRFDTLDGTLATQDQANQDRQLMYSNDMKTYLGGDGMDGSGGIVGTGFANLEGANATRYDALMTQGQDAQADINTNIADSYALSSAERTNNFDALTANLDSTREGLKTVAADNQVANLEQQQAIMAALESAGLQRTNYYEDLKADTQDTITRLGTFQGDFADYKGQYDDNTTLATQQRGQIATNQGVNTNDLLNANANAQAAAAGFASQNQLAINQANTALSGIGSSVDQFGNSITSLTNQNNQQDFANVAQMISSGFQANSVEDQNMRNEFVNRLDTVRNTLADQNANIDQEFRNTYGTMVDSFDDTGSLIRQSALANGDYITRAIDDSGRLILSQFSANGNLNNQTALNINQLMARMDELGYIPGSNVTMASPTGTQLTYSGGANPYSATLQ